MKDYTVIITETSKREVKVKAESTQEALDKVELDWGQSIHVLDYSDFEQSDFTIKQGKKLELASWIWEELETADSDITEEVGYSLRDREEFINDLISWISEATKDKELMKTDLEFLMSVDDKYILSSTSTNEYIIESVDSAGFKETINELLKKLNIRI